MIASAPEEMKVHSLKPDSQFSTEGASSISDCFLLIPKRFCCYLFCHEAGEICLWAIIVPYMQVSYWLDLKQYSYCVAGIHMKYSVLPLLMVTSYCLRGFPGMRGRKVLTIQ
jgi:hypothetical protein